MQEMRIKNLSEFTQIICEIDNGLIRNGADKNEKLLFRGQSNTCLLYTSDAADE